MNKSSKRQYVILRTLRVFLEQLSSFGIQDSSLSNDIFESMAEIEEDILGGVTPKESRSLRASIHRVQAVLSETLPEGEITASLWFSTIIGLVSDECDEIVDKSKNFDWIEKWLRLQQMIFEFYHEVDPDLESHLDYQIADQAINCVRSVMS